MSRKIKEGWIVQLTMEGQLSKHSEQKGTPTSDLTHITQNIPGVNA